MEPSFYGDGSRTLAITRQLRRVWKLDADQSGDRTSLSTVLYASCGTCKGVTIMAKSTRIAIGLALFIVSATPVRADDPWKAASILAGGVYVGLATADARGTIACVQAGTCHEANPAIRPIVDRHGIVPAMSGKLGFNVGTVAAIWAVNHKWPGHRKRSTLMLIAMDVVQGYVVYRNNRVLKGERR